jgi:Tfp pilus assembly protein PilF
LRKHYAVAGVVVAILVATLIVVAGSRSSSDSESVPDTTGTPSAPAGHPAVGTNAPDPADYSAMVKLLATRYSRDPADTKTALALANAYLMTDQPTKARRLYTKVLKSDPGNETAQVQLAMAFHGDGNDAQAFQLLNGVLRSDPSSQLAHYDLAGLYFSEQKSSLARDEWKKAAALDPASGVGKMAQNFVDLMAQNTGKSRPNSDGG